MTEKLKRVYLGECGVDSGLLMLIDPCYVKHIEGLCNDEKWGGFCDILHAKGNDTHDGVELQSGVVFSTGYGDGGYQLYGYQDSEGRIMKIEMDFSFEDEEDEE